jgi:hypothetical protein
VGIDPSSARESAVLPTEAKSLAFKIFNPLEGHLESGTTGVCTREGIPEEITISGQLLLATGKLGSLGRRIRIAHLELLDFGFAYVISPLLSC